MFNLIETKWKIQKTLSENALLILALGACAPLYLRNVFRYSVPMGYAGLFTQMAKQIADANFHLPFESPYYGPGGIPFAYPPLGLYLLAVLIKLTGKYFVFLRILPPILGLLSLIPLYGITLEFSKSHISAAASIIIAASSQDLHIANAWAAGIVRAPACLFCLSAIYFLIRQQNKRSMLNSLLAGVFLGLTLMTHLIYALFCFLWVWWWSLFRKNIFEKIKDAIIISGIGILVASMWLVPVLFRYGSVIFLRAFNSHGGSFLLSFWSYPGSLINIFLQNLSPISASWPLLLFVFIGVLLFLIKRKFAFITLYLLVILAFPESARFVFLIGSIAAGIGFSAIPDLLSSISPERLKSVLVAALIIPFLGFFWYEGLTSMSKKLPQLSAATLDLSDHVQEIMPPDHTYLPLVKQDEAEWMPFLFQREPVVGKWGGEWLGIFTEQTQAMGVFRNCQANQDWACVENTITRLNVEPLYMITYVKDRNLNNSIQIDGIWKRMYENDRYVLWELVK